MVKNKSVALIPEGRLKRIYAIENAVRASGEFGTGLESAIRYVRAGRGALIPCEMNVGSECWSDGFHKRILESRVDIDLMTSLFLAAAKKVYVPKLHFGELELPHIEHLRYKVAANAIRRQGAPSIGAKEWLATAATKRRKETAR